MVGQVLVEGRTFRHEIPHDLLPTGSEERGVMGVGSIPVAILPSCQDIKIIALYLLICIDMNLVG